MPFAHLMAQETDPSQNGIFFYEIRGALSSLKTNNQKKAKNKQKKTPCLRKLMFLLIKGLFKLTYCVQVSNNFSCLVCSNVTRNWFIVQALLNRWENWPVIGQEARF